MEEFAGRGPAAEAADDHRLADPSPHGDSMHVIRDALLSQLQKDRLRQDIVVAELARIERAMALRTAASGHGTSNSSATPAVTPKNLSPSVKWSCGICQVEAASEGNLKQHFAGQKHRANITALNKAKAILAAEKSRKARQICPTWACKFCVANCTGKSVLEDHLRGKKHYAKVEALLEECESMARGHALASPEADSNPDTVAQDEEDEAKPDSVLIFCQTCQVKCTSPSVRDSHVRGKKHQMNAQALQLEAKRLGITVSMKRQTPTDWGGTRHRRSIPQREGTNVHSVGLESEKKIPADGDDSLGVDVDWVAVEDWVEG